MKFVVTMVRDGDGMVIAECPAIPGCVSQGKTETKVEENIRQASQACLEVRAKQGMHLTVSDDGRR